MFESALVNSCVLYKATREAAPLPLEYSHQNFCISIALALASEWESMGCVNQEGVLNSPTTEYSNQPFRKAKKSLQIWAEHSNRGQQTNITVHLQAVEKIPLLKEGKNPGNQRVWLCEHCKKRRTTVWCKICAAPLCHKRGSNCFAEFDMTKTDG